MYDALKTKECRNHFNTLIFRRFNKLKSAEIPARVAEGLFYFALHKSAMEIIKTVKTNI